MKCFVHLSKCVHTNINYPTRYSAHSRNTPVTLNVSVPLYGTYEHASIYLFAIYWTLQTVELQEDKFI